MQDRFKFRIWNGAEMHYNDFVVTATGFVGKITEEFLGNCVFNQEDLTADKECVLMQCTGLKDKHGRFIFEGDVVKDLTYLYNVRYLCVFAPIFGGLGLMSIQNWKDYNFCRENWEDYYSNSEIRRLDNRFKLANQGNKLKCFSMRELKMNDYEVIGNIYENKELLNEI